MKLAVVGAGNVGLKLAEAACDSRSLEVTVIDKNERRLKSIRRNQGVETVQLDVLSHPSIVEASVKGFDIVCSLLPGAVGDRIWAPVINAGVNLVDVSFTKANPLLLHKKALEKNIIFIPDSGVAPGLSNIIAGRIYSSDNPRKIKIMVGGISAENTGLLGLSATWNIQDLIEEYLRPARLIRNSRLISVNPLDEIYLVSIPGLGELEAFPTDGLRTMLHTLTSLEELVELTLRYKGHCEKMRFLRDIGLLSDKDINVDGKHVKSSSILAELLRLSLPTTKDKLVMVIQAENSVKRAFRLIHHGIRGTAMAEVTAYTAMSIIEALAAGVIDLKGVVPPEVLGFKREIYDYIVRRLSDRGIKVEEADPVDVHLSVGDCWLGEINNR
ncbi:MAG TPA: hypothetical protein ENF42_00270 [Candidatus Bathyarchaeota archaeon]|nr:hypothetical protein [Candidatus Bathyarchaeota archaeon]